MGTREIQNLDTSLFFIFIYANLIVSYGNSTDLAYYYSSCKNKVCSKTWLSTLVWEAMAVQHKYASHIPKIAIVSNPYLRDHWQLSQKAIGIEIDDLPVLYDAWRREVLSYFLDIPISRLPKLVSVND